MFVLLKCKAKFITCQVNHNTLFQESLTSVQLDENVRNFVCDVTNYDVANPSVTFVESIMGHHVYAG